MNKRLWLKLNLKGIVYDYFLGMLKYISHYIGLSGKKSFPKRMTGNNKFSDSLLFLNFKIYVWNMGWIQFVVNLIQRITRNPYMNDNSI